MTDAAQPLSKSTFQFPSSTSSVVYKAHFLSLLGYYNNKVIHKNDFWPWTTTKRMLSEGEVLLSVWQASPTRGRWIQHTVLHTTRRLRAHAWHIVSHCESVLEEWLGNWMWTRSHCEDHGSARASQWSNQKSTASKLKAPFMVCLISDPQRWTNTYFPSLRPPFSLLALPLSPSSTQLTLAYLSTCYLSCCCLVLFSRKVSPRSSLSDLSLLRYVVT